MRSSISNKSRVGEEHLVGSLFLLMQNVDSVYHLFIGGDKTLQVSLPKSPRYIY